MGVRLKQVKPEAFNSQAFRLEMVRMTAKITKDMEKDYRKTTAKWKKKPTWIREVNYSSSKIETFILMTPSTLAVFSMYNINFSTASSFGNAHGPP